MSARMRVGDVVVKSRGGGSRRARVVRVWYPPSGVGADRPSPVAELEALAPSVRKGGRSEKVNRWTVALGEDNLPDGWRRSTVEHDWRGGISVADRLPKEFCCNLGCSWLRLPEGVAWLAWQADPVGATLAGAAVAGFAVMWLAREVYW